MEPARSVIQKLGGEARVSEITGTSYTAPYRWQHAKDKGGTGGLIPQKHHRAILDYAREQGIEVGPSDLIVPSAEAAA